jgi:hypothetical protein
VPLRQRRQILLKTLTASATTIAKHTFFKQQTIFSIIDEKPKTPIQSNSHSLNLQSSLQQTTRHRLIQLLKQALTVGLLCHLPAAENEFVIGKWLLAVNRKRRYARFEKL